MKALRNEPNNGFGTKEQAPKFLSVSHLASDWLASLRRPSTGWLGNSFWSWLWSSQWKRNPGKTKDSWRIN